MHVAQPDAPYQGLVGADAPPAWALPLIEAVQDIRDEFRRADLPRMRAVITAMQNHFQTTPQRSAAARFSEVQDDLETATENLESLPTESSVSETVKEELKPVKADIDSVQKALDSVKEGFIAAAPDPLERTVAFTNELYIDSRKSSNMMKAHPVDLQQVPAPDGTLPWNTRVGGPDGEEIVLAPLVSLDAIQALGAKQLGVYVQLYYPGREVPEDLAERKRLILRAIGRSREAYEIV